jgi:hypothetical protein
VAVSGVDWRFLLPAPPAEQFRHLVVLDGPEGLERRLRDLGLAHQVETAFPALPTVDALVLLGGGDARWREASRALAPDAVVYWEVDRRRYPWLGARAVGRRLRAAGLREVASYWVLPGFHDARRYLPVHAAGAIPWYFNTRFVAGTAARAALASLVSRAGARSGPQVRAVAPCLAVVAARAGRASTLPLVLADAGLPVAVRTTEARPLLFTSGQDEGSRLVALPFLGSAAAPELVIKLARLPGFSAHTEREQLTLDRLRELLPPTLRESLPVPLGRSVGGGGAVFLESVVPGRTVAASVGRWRTSVARQLEDLRAASGWLAEFHRATLVQRAEWNDVAITRWVERPQAEYERTFGRRPEEQALFDAVRRRARALMGGSFPIVWSHNDLNPAHVYRAGTRVSVIDWEFGCDDISERHGPALCDLVYFLSYWIQLARGSRGEAASLQDLADVLFAAERDARCDGARAALLEYARSLELALGFVPMLIVYTWVDRALDRHRRRLATDGAVADARAGNRFARYVEVLARGARELFAAWDAG